MADHEEYQQQRRREREYEMANGQMDMEADGGMEEDEYQQQNRGGHQEPYNPLRYKQN